MGTKCDFRSIGDTVVGYINGKKEESKVSEAMKEAYYQGLQT